jgi:hypothetical protein
MSIYIRTLIPTINLFTLVSSTSARLKRVSPPCRNIPALHQRTVVRKPSPRLWVENRSRDGYLFWKQWLYLWFRTLITINLRRNLIWKPRWILCPKRSIYTFEYARSGILRYPLPKQENGDKGENDERSDDLTEEYIGRKSFPSGV